MSALVLFLRFEIETGDGPGPELDNFTFDWAEMKNLPHHYLEDMAEDSLVK